MFQSTLAPEGASDALRVVWPYRPQCFNPRSHPRVRATCNVCKREAVPRVSIHARTRGCERRTTGGLPVQAAVFQSTLAPEGASDRQRVDGHDRLECFNPRSHPRVRATRPKFKIHFFRRFQSTLAPEGASDGRGQRRGRGQARFQSTLAPEGASDGRGRESGPIYRMFQSTLAPEGASDGVGRRVSTRIASFNPRSHPRVRATRLYWLAA